jgi:chemosensory pili system protein ChpC
MTDSIPREIRGVMIPVTGGRLLLPNATIAEVVSYVAPEQIANAPDWLLGRLTWRGWHLPLFSFAILSGTAVQENVSNAKVAILKGLSGNAKLPFVALLAQGFPRLTTIMQDTLISAGGENDRAQGIRAHVLVRSDHAIIPDLNRIENLVVQALAA